MPNEITSWAEEKSLDGLTQYHASYFAHELTRRQGSGENNVGIIGGSVADAKIDLNPHQVQAALFAFRSPFSKGVILADEVGLGKTIEAGLVLKQKWSQRKRRLLIVCPANLRKQWAEELETKFYLPSIILESKEFRQQKKSGVNPLDLRKNIICSYQFAAKYESEIITERWDLAVIDEAHRLRNVYRTGTAQTAKAIKRSLLSTQKVLLTATPLNVSIMDLYGLVSVIDEGIFHDDKSFRAQYAHLAQEGAEAAYAELKNRISPVCHRTLRRDVLQYIRYPDRRAYTEMFSQTEAEAHLYQMVTEYLSRDSLFALPTAQRQLITMLLRRQLSSSSFAIAGTLQALVKRLKEGLSNGIYDVTPETVANGDVDELDEDMTEARDAEEDETQGIRDESPETHRAAVEAEIQELERLVSMANNILQNEKGNALLKALRTNTETALTQGRSDKAIIFTESRRTQEYLIRLLKENGYDGKLVLFNGTNNDPESIRIQAAWERKYQGTRRISDSPNANRRQALVDYFRDTAQIMIATEAGAEGINLQFCATVINYDLPWNPMRIEQRIGRCHRYGQKDVVVVINFINRDNKADQRVYELLNERLKLFDGVFGASDEVLGIIADGMNFEARVEEIYRTCHTAEQMDVAFKKLQEEMDELIRTARENARQDLLSNFEVAVLDLLRLEGQCYINKYDAMLWNITRYRLGQTDAIASGNVLLDNKRKRITLRSDFICDAAYMPENQEARILAGEYSILRNDDTALRYYLDHPLAQWLITACKQEFKAPELESLTLDYTNWGCIANELAELVNASGTLMLSQVSFEGLDAQDHLVFAAITDTGEIVHPDVAQRFFQLPVKACACAKANEVANNTLAHATEEAKKAILAGMETQQSKWFKEEMEKVDLWVADQIKLIRYETDQIRDEVEKMQRAARTTAASLQELIANARQQAELQGRIEESVTRERELTAKLNKQKKEMLDRIVNQLTQTTNEKKLFTIRWSIV
jgi:ERCC4-related helicase